MAFDYSSLAGTATDLLTEFNQGTLKLIKVANGTGSAFDPGTPTETEYDVVGTVKGVDKKYIDGTLIQTGDLEVIINVHATQVPTLKDKISIDGSKYEIIQVSPTPPAGSTIVNKIIVRK